ncbi:MAG TPA: hypothetical protein VK211_11595, partial [Kamptonema sp.]|nr:hypothetical protein [Kamptonema sp.]
MNTVKSIENSSFFKYKAVRVKQTNTGDWLVLFAASASEIEMWVGIPQKKKIGDQETTGFQREENKKRINEIMNFYENEKNIIQNPLLCALRQPQKATVIFEVGVDEQNSNDTIQYGFLTISNEPLEKLSLLELLKRVKIDLERRVPDLAYQQLPDQIIRELKQRAEINISQENSEEISDDQPETTEDADTEGSLEISLTDESHILDFWQEIAAYVSVLEEIKDTFTGDTFLDYSRKSLISFLRPVVVVDGQHRLLAAIAAGKKLAREEPYLTDLEEELLHNETNPEEAQKKIEIKASRKLPVSLLMNTDPAEHVFQFVVVNQKATPIKPALLGTIVST